LYASHITAHPGNAAAAALFCEDIASILLKSIISTYFEQSRGAAACAKLGAARMIRMMRARVISHPVPSALILWGDRGDECQALGLGLVLGMD
jgi:hypothetical protein